MPAVAADVKGVTNICMIVSVGHCSGHRDIQDPINNNINLMLEEKGF